LDLRFYARAKEQYEESQKIEDASKRPNTPGIERVRQIHFELAREEMERKLKAQESND